MTAAANTIVKRVHTLIGVDLQVKFFQESVCKATDTLKVVGLPEGISKDLIELYFESPKSGGCAGAIKTLSLLGPTSACIQFTSDGSKDTCIIHIINPWHICKSYVSYCVCA